MRLPILFLTVSSLVLSLPAGAQERDTPPPLSDLGNLTVIGIDAARAAGLTGRGVVVGILDSGIQDDHPEFAGRVLGTFDYETGEPATLPPVHAHGTHVLGTMAGQNVGVAPGAGILSAAIFTPSTGMIDEAEDLNILVPGALRWAVEGGARVINNSWGTDNYVTEVDPDDVLTFAPGLLQAFRDTAEAGVVMVWSNGNDSLGNPSIEPGMPFHFPELQPTWIAVAALARGDIGIAPYSNLCGVAARWCITAPGGGPGDDQGIWSSVTGGLYAAYDEGEEVPWAGTSMAAPHVSGAVAIGMEMFPDADPRDIVQLVLRTAIDVGDPGVDDVYGWGFLSLGNLVATTDAETASVLANAAWSRFSALEVAGQALRQRAAGGAPGVAGAEGAGRLWFQPLGGLSRLDAGPASAAATSRTAGFLAGADILDNGPWQAGLGAGYSRTSLGETGRSDGADTTAIHGVAYARYEDGPWFAQMTGQVATFRQTVERHSISGTAGTAEPPVGTSRLKGRALAGDLRFGREVHARPGRAIAAYLASTAMTQRTARFQEQDAGAFGLTGDRSSLTQYAAGIGLRWTEAIARGAEAPVRVVTDLAVMRRFGDLDHGSTLSLLGAEVASATGRLSEQVVRISGRVEAPMRLGQAYLGYEATLPDKALSVSLGLNMRF